MPQLLRRMGLTGARVAVLAGQSTGWMYNLIRRRFPNTVIDWHIIELIRKAVGERLFDLAYAEVFEDVHDDSVRVSGMELLKMIKYLGLSHEKAAAKLGISRSQLNRLVCKHYSPMHQPLPLVYITLLQQNLGQDAYLDVLSWVRSTHTR